MKRNLCDTLKKYWGYDSFRPMQREIIESVLEGRDTLALLPTGGGKSITYQLPAMILDGLCIVVTPLISLMKDQVDSLRKRGISAVAIHSGLTHRQIDIALDNCVYGDTKFLYVSPERLTNEMFRLRVDKMNVALLAVDEAHCISQWGYDFRPSYLRIAELRNTLPNTPILALTASATQRVAKDIIQQLRFASPNILQGSFSRPNLSYSVREADDKRQQLMRIINNVEGTGIVYVNKREDAEMLCKELIDEGVSASFYHAGLPTAERNLRQDEWRTNKTRIMVATNAFGMGIDKSDVRFVVHYSMPDSLEAYYQEAGRAGRDGKRSYAVLLTESVDKLRMQTILQSQFPPTKLISEIYDTLCAYLQVAIGDGREASFIFNIFDFCRHAKLDTATVYSAIKLLNLNGYLTLIEDCDNPARIKFNISRDDLYHLSFNEREELILHALLRLYSGIFTEFRPINEMEIATFSHQTHEEVHELLKRLWRANIIRYIPANQKPMIFLDEERLPKRDIYIAPETYTRRMELMEERFEHLLNYVESENICRSNIIENYFADSTSEPCGICDNCLARKRQEQRGESPASAQNIDREILRYAEHGNMNLRQISERIKGNQDLIAERFEHLINEHRIEVASIDGVVKLRQE